MMHMTYLVEAGENKRFTCPLCGKPDRAAGSQGKTFPHTSPKGKFCDGTLVMFKELSGDDLLAAAEALGRRVHQKDKDKSGEPYWMHLQGVADGVKVLVGYDPEAIAAAWLHDVVEDHPSQVSFTKLREWGYPQTVIEAVKAVTKVSGEEQSKYLDRIIAAGETAMIVKLADLMHNTRRDRLEDVAKKKDEYTRKRLLRKYTPAKARLMLELGIIQTPEGQELATKPVGTAGGGSYTKSADGSVQYDGASLMKGDWPAGWSSPIHMKLKGKDAKSSTARYQLEDGTVKSVDTKAKFKVWTKPYSKPKSGKGWTPAQEKQPTESKTPAKPSTQTSIKSLPASKAPNALPAKPIDDLPIVSRTETHEEPSASKSAPRSLCGTCGRETYQITSHFWTHMDPVGNPYHSATRPTPQRVKRLLEEGLVSWTENKHSLHVTRRIDSTRVEWECICGKTGKAADIYKYAQHHCSKKPE